MEFNNNLLKDKYFCQIFNISIININIPFSLANIKYLGPSEKKKSP